MQGTQASPDPLDQLPLTRRHLLILLICTLGSLWDIAEVNIGSILSSVYSLKSSPIAPGQLSWLLASMYVGAIVGAPVLGWLADRYGRRPALVTTLSILGTASLAAALSPNIAMLTSFRMLSGFAIGGFPAVMITYITDVMPVRERGRMMLLASGISFLAAPATLFGAKLLNSMPLVGLDAWRWICGGAGLGAALTAACALRLSESPRWLRANGHHERAEREQRLFESSVPLFGARNGSAGLLIGSASAAHAAGSPRPPAQSSSSDSEASTPHSAVPFWRAILVGALCFLSPWSTVGFSLLSGAVLISKGFDLSSTFMFTGIVAFGTVFGLIVASLWIDRLARKTALLLSAVAMGISEVSFGIASRPWAIISAGLLFMVFTSIYVTMLSFYIAEFFPTRTRARATSTTWAVNRVASMLVPLVLLPLLKARGAFWMCSAIAVTLLVSIALLAIAPRGRAGQTVA